MSLIYVRSSVPVSLINVRSSVSVSSVVSATGGVICYSNGVFSHEPKSGKDFLVMTLNLPTN